DIPTWIYGISARRCGHGVVITVEAAGSEQVPESTPHSCRLLWIATIQRHSRLGTRATQGQDRTSKRIHVASYATFARFSLARLQIQNQAHYKAPLFRGSSAFNFHSL